MNADRTADRISQLTAERRQMTVLFCDLVGSTSLADRLDPEDLLDVFQSFGNMCSRVAASCEGRIERYEGDGILIHFGDPTAREDDAARAVLCGLHIVSGLRRAVRDGSVPVHLAVRVGVATGEVVVGPGPDPPASRRVTGLALHVAKRLQECAEPGHVLVSESTHAVVSRSFACAPVGKLELKGLSTAVCAYRVIGERPAQPRPTGDSPMVDRHRELDLLRGIWRELPRGGCRVVALVGEAGVGKSRIVRALREEIAGDRHHELVLACSSLHQHTAFHPLGEYLRHVAGLRPGVTDARAATRLRTRLREFGVTRADEFDALAWLAGVALDGQDAIGTTPERLRAQVMSAVPATLIHIARASPTLLVIEDLQWADPSTRDLLRAAVERVCDVPILVLLTSRTVPADGFMDDAVIHRVEALDDEHISTLVDEIVGGRSIGRSVRRRIIEKAGGLPLFAEELARALSTVSERLSEAGATEWPADLSAIPPALQDPLMARLDGLDARERKLAQIAAFLTPPFSAELLTAVVARVFPQAVHDVASLLEGLVRSGLLIGVPADDGTSYRFRHGLLQDTAYGSTVRSVRRGYHKCVAELLEQIPGTSEYEVLAYHFIGARDLLKAIYYLTRAANVALERSAGAEAATHLQRAQELTEGLEPGPEAARQQHRIHNDLGVALMAARGFGASSVKQVFDRGLEAATWSHDETELFRTYWGLARYHLVKTGFLDGRPGLEHGRDYAARALRIAQARDDAVLLTEAHLVAGVADLWLGDFASALAHYEKVEHHYDDRQYRRLLMQFGEDPRTLFCSRMAFPLWMLGFADDAVERCERARRLAQESGHDLSLVRALAFLGWVHQFRGEPAQTARCAEAVIEGAHRHDSRFWLLCGLLQRSWAQAASGSLEAGRSRFAEALEETEAIGTVGRTYHRGLLAELALEAGDHDGAARALEQAFAQAASSGDGFWKAELLRLRAVLCWKDGGGVDEAIGALGEALRVAESQGARSLQLRAAISLARIQARAGRRQEGLGALAPLLATFRQGHGTRDLREARALLAGAAD